MDSLRSIWNQMPALRLLIPFIAGIGLCIASGDAAGCLIWISGAFLALSFIALIFVNRISRAQTIYRWRYASGILMLVLMLSLGYVVTFFNTEGHDDHDISKIDRTFLHAKATYAGVIADPPVIRDKTMSVLIELQKVARNYSSMPVSGKVFASIAKDDRSEALRYGDQLLFVAEITPYEEPENPGQFDYKAYQALHHIHYRAYLTGPDWRVSDTAQGNTLLARIYVVRDYFLSVIKECVHGPNELAVATAIMLGYRDYVTDEVTQAYAGSGVLHVLSVSGLHVAVLYYVINILLGWMDRKRRLKITKGILVIVIMLFYAVLTGLSPPVLRSVWMFSLITVAKLLDREVSMYNVLAVSCLALLIWDPYYIGDVGFQLSYIAVAGIVYLYPKLHALLPYPSYSFRRPFGLLGKGINYILEFIWGLVCVSIAAQIATFPISLFYFHTFPNYFLLSNLLVIPLSNLVLISGMLLFAFGWSHALMSLSGWVFDHLLILLNHIVFWINGLPFALSRDMVLTAFEMTILYILIAMVCWFIADRRPKVLLLTLVFALLVCTSFSVRSIHNDNQCQLTVYHVPGKKAIELIVGRVAYYDFDTALINNEILMRYNVKGHWSQCGVESEVPIDKGANYSQLPFGSVYMIKNNAIMVIDKQENFGVGPKVRVEVLILSENCPCTITSICGRIDFKYLVFDTSNKPYQVKKWIEECRKSDLIYYDCRDKAFTLSL